MQTNIKTNLVGFQFHKGAKDRLLAASPGQELRLERDPDNKYDENAVKILDDEGQLGFVPRAYSERIAKILDDGRDVSVTLEGQDYTGISLTFDD